MFLNKYTIGTPLPDQNGEKEGANNLSDIITTKATSYPSVELNQKAMTEPLIDLTKCKSVTITNSGNSYGVGSEYQPISNNTSTCKSLGLEPRFLLICIILLVVLMLLLIFVGYWLLTKSKRYEKANKEDRDFLKSCVYGAGIVIFIIIVFLIYLILF